MAVCAERYQVDGVIGATLTPEIEVVDLKMFALSAELATHPIALQGGIARCRVPT